MRSSFEDPNDQLRITAHELLMSHLWTVLWDIYPESKNYSKTFWAVNELATNAILGLDSAFEHSWSKKTRGYDQYLSNYPQLTNIKLMIKENYINKSSFQVFLNFVLNKVKDSQID